MPMGKISLSKPRKFSKRKGSALAIAKSNKRRITTINNRIENKYAIQNRASAPFAFINNQFLLNALVQGNTEFTRTGIPKPESLLLS